MGERNLSPGVCFECRQNVEKRNKNSVSISKVPCEDETDICGYTHIGINDEENGMNVHPLVNMIALMWRDITLISPRVRIEKMQDKKQMIQFQPSINLITQYLDTRDWENMPLSYNETFHLISIFHINYIGAIS